MKYVEYMPFKPFFDTRMAAGEEMASELLKTYQAAKPAIVLGIPRGGVLVAAPVARKLGAPLDVISPRKLPIPDSPEMGFGAVTADGTVYLNESLVRDIAISKAEIDSIVETVRREVLRREKVYRGERPFPDVSGKTVFVVDDGLATGYTMLAALRSVRNRGPKLLVAAAPCTPLNTLELIKKEADDVVILVAQQSGGFAVASFYKIFDDLPDSAVTTALNQLQTT